MKIIKRGNLYRKHKCSKCKTIFAYHIYNDVCVSEVLHCPECHNYLDFTIFDKRMSENEYNKIKELKKGK